MIGSILKFAAGLFAGNVGSAVGKTVANGATIAALLAAMYPLWKWYHSGGKDEVAVTLSLTYGEAIFFALIVALVVKVAQYTPAPRPMEMRTRSVDLDATRE